MRKSAIVVGANAPAESWPSCTVREGSSPLGVGVEGSVRLLILNL